MTQSQTDESQPTPESEIVHLYTCQPHVLDNVADILEDMGSATFAARVVIEWMNGRNIDGYNPKFVSDEITGIGISLISARVAAKRIDDEERVQIINKFGGVLKESLEEPMYIQLEGGPRDKLDVEGDTRTIDLAEALLGNIEITASEELL